MKKIVAPKLVLRRETLRGLSAVQIKQVRGGVGNSEGPGCPFAAAVVVVPAVEANTVG